LKTIFLWLLALTCVTVSPVNASADDPPAYVGVRKCKMCHMKKYISWAETSMATTFENLKQGVKVNVKTALGFEDRDYTANPECLKCHTTGYGKGGFISIDATPDLAGITCEACHGPGSKYRKVMKQGRDALIAAGLVVPFETGCLECHSGDSPFLKGKIFNFEEASARTHDHSMKK
jgi:hypothetical protein